VAAAEAGGFAAAGERLHLTRSAVAKAIARIEEKRTHPVKPARRMGPR
jgi:DNA-binding transcriptional LysR family regulator